MQCSRNASDLVMQFYSPKRGMLKERKKS